jgi:hypothetical protein
LKLTDFGLARLTEEAGLTASGEHLGTPGFMAPEQAAGRAPDVGPSADTYSLGALLYCLLVGRPPFQAATPLETMRLVLDQEPVPPCQLNPGVPRDLETICLKCLSKEPTRRYASATELADDLARHENEEPIRARPVSRLERSVKWVKRNPVVTGLALAVVLALAVGTLVSSLKYRDVEQQRSIAEKQRSIAEKQRSIALEKEGVALQEAEKANKARDFLVSLCQLSETDVKGGNAAARLVLAEAEKRIPKEFADQPELRADLMSSIAKVKRVIGRRTPQAMILEVRGMVRLQSATGKTRPALPQTLVNLDDRLTLSADAQVQLVFLSDLHKEWLKPGREVTIESRGSKPADAILERDNSILMTFVRLPKGNVLHGLDRHEGIGQEDGDPGGLRDSRPRRNARAVGSRDGRQPQLFLPQGQRQERRSGHFRRGTETVAGGAGVVERRAGVPQEAE